jgi:hypothetical protein
MTTESKIRSFAFNNVLFIEEIKKIEAEHGLTLIDQESNSKPSNSSYYRQFDEKSRSEASIMGDHYEVFYCLERSIRSIIRQQLDTANNGPTWWKTPHVPQVVLDDVAKRLRKEQEAAITPRSEDELDYTTFGELGEIIKANPVVFSAIFNNPRALEKVLSSLNLLRNNIAHCCPLADDEVVRLTLTIRDWFRLME